MSGYPNMHQWESLHNHINKTIAPATGHTQISACVSQLKAELSKCRYLRNRAEQMTHARLADELESIWTEKLINNPGYKTDIIISEILHRLRLTEFNQLLTPVGGTPLPDPGKTAGGGNDIPPLREGEGEQGKKHTLNPYFVFDTEPEYGMVLVFHHTSREARYLGFQQWPAGGAEYIWFRALRAHDEYNRFRVHNQPHVIDSYDSDAETWLQALNEQFGVDIKSSYKNCKQ